MGFDCSAYTTSVARVTPTGQWCQSRRILPVPAGNRGLRARDAVFAHMKNLPDLVEEVLADIRIDDLAGVSVSVAPRPVVDSYLPPFLAGEAVARSLAALARIPLFRTSHQEGHIRAGLAGTGLPADQAFFALHVSGGTTELLAVEPSGPGWRFQLIGASDDLYAGQMVDRIGVLLGLPFPAGPEIDRLAESVHDEEPIPWSRPRRLVNGWRISFSGPETAAERAVREGADPARMARGVMEAISQSLAALVVACGVAGPLLVIGGVAANTHLRRRLTHLLQPHGVAVWFADPDWSRDNAIGVAYLGLDALARKRAGSAEEGV